MRQFYALLGSTVDSAYEFLIGFLRSIVAGTKALWVWAKANPVGIGTLLLAAATFMVALESRQQIGIMQLDQRPWVSATPTSERVWMSDWNGSKNLGISLQFNLHNYGRLPAQDVRINTMIAPRPNNADLNKLDAPQEKTCSEAAGQKTSQHTTTTVFPGHDVSDSTSVSIGEVYQTENSTIWEVYGCIDYVFSSGSHGQTLYRYILGKIDRDIWIGLPFVKGATILMTSYGPLSRIVLRRAQFDFGIDDSGGNYVR